jgi:LPS sulfotransferase NodH
MKSALLDHFRRVWLPKFLSKPGELRGPSAKLGSLRPDALDLIGLEFDRDSSTPAQRTIILCSAPCTGSYELCRLLTAAGLGIPHEYFNPFPAGRLMARWSLKEHPLSEAAIAPYIDMLRRRRTSSDVFSTKLHYWQFDAFLRNRHGAGLFRDACVVHLFRPDIAAQFTAFRTAIETGQWDHSERQTTKSDPPARAVEEIIAQLQSLIAEDAGFRKLFGLLGIRPIFITTEQLFADSQAVVASIGRAVNVSIDENALKNMIALSSPYPRAAGAKSAMNGIRQALRERAFTK